MMPLPHDPPCRSVRYELTADADAGLLPRLLAPFARRSLLPDHLRVRRQGAVVLVEIGMDAMPSEAAHLVEGNLRQVVGVRRLAVVLRGERQQAA